MKRKNSMDIHADLIDNPTIKIYWMNGIFKRIEKYDHYKKWNDEFKYHSSSSAFSDEWWSINFENSRINEPV